MPKYRVYYTQVTEIGVTVEADDPEAAIEAADEKGHGGICAQCSGWGQTWFRDESGELEPEAVFDEDAGTEVWSSGERWSRMKA